MDCSEALAVIKLRNFLTREHSRMNRKTRQGTATRSITLFTSIHVSLPLTWLVIISSTSWSSCVGIPMHTRCCSEVRQNVPLCCCCSACGRYRKPGPKGWLSWTEVVLCGCVTVISTKVTNFKVENSKLKKKCCKENALSHFQLLAPYFYSISACFRHLSDVGRGCFKTSRYIFFSGSFMCWFKHFALFSLSKGRTNWAQSTFVPHEKGENEDFTREHVVATYIIAAILG